MELFSIRIQRTFQLVSTGYKNQNTIASAFSLSNAGSIASIIQLLLM